MQTIHITGEVQFPDGTPHFQGGTLFVTVQDVSQMDAASALIAQAVQPEIVYDGQPLSFQLTAALPEDSTASYNVRAHLSRTGDAGQFHQGDYISTQHHAVSTEAEQTIAIPVQAV